MFAFCNIFKSLIGKGACGQDGISCLPPCIVYYYCIESESEQIITKLPWSIKDNNN